jgi:signal transduction histidine kinase
MPAGSSDSEAGRPVRFPLHYRILVPLVLAALFVTAVATWVSVGVTANALQVRLEAQLLNSVAAVTWRDFALNSAILLNLKTVIGADVITFGPDGSVVASSLAAPAPAMVGAVRSVVTADRQSPPPTARTRSADCGFPCMVAFRAVEGHPGTTVALVMDTSPLVAATRDVIRTILWSALASVAVLAVVGQLVARQVTVPLNQLLRFVRTAGPSDSTRRAEVGADEVGALATAFNGLLDRLDQSRAALVRSEKLGLAGLFAARVAHDIRNPLSSIRMQTQLLQSKAPPGSDDREVLSDMLRDVDQVESVVRDLMELANPGALRTEPVSPNEVVRAALEQVAHQLAHRKIVVEASLADHLPKLPLDAGRFKQALLNLIVNGSEAMHTGGTLQVSTGCRQDGTIEVRICDDGVGIDPALLDRVFDPFVSTKPEGVGLGLVNVKAVVEGHGGRISLERREPRGTCAAIELPGPARG